METVYFVLVTLFAVGCTVIIVAKNARLKLAQDLVEGLEYDLRRARSAMEELQVTVDSLTAKLALSEDKKQRKAPSKRVSWPQVKRELEAGEAE